MKNTIKYTFLVLLGAGLMSGFSCKKKKKKDEPVEVTCDYSVTNMLSGIGNNIIIPRFASLTQTTLALKTEAASFVTQLDSASLVSLQKKFNTAYLSYQKVGMLNFGPALTSGFNMRERMNIFPISLATFEMYMNNGNTQPSQNINATVGFPAIEYLIFGNMDSVLADFTTSPQAANRKTYLVNLTDYLHQLSSTVYNAWIPSGGNYIATFVADGGNSVGSPLSLLVNEFNFDFETLKNFKYKIPLGKFHAGIIQPDKVEGYYSGTSVALSAANADAIYKLYLGVAESGADGEGLHDYLVCLDAYYQTQGVSLASSINSQLALIYSKILAIPDPMSATLSSNKQVIEDAHNEMQIAVPLVKREMTAAMGVQISYTDNDGD
jgi:predicted lipoprotein